MKSPTLALLASAAALAATATAFASPLPTNLRNLAGDHGGHAHDHSKHDGVHLDFNLVNVRKADGSYNNLQSQCVCAGTFNKEVDYFPKKMVTPTDAVGFNITYHKYYKVLTNRATSKVYVLVQCGAPEPPASEISASTYTTLKVPLTKVASRSTTYLPMIETIGERETIVKIVGRSCSAEAGVKGEQVTVERIVAVTGVLACNCRVTWLYSALLFAALHYSTHPRLIHSPTTLTSTPTPIPGTTSVTSPCLQKQITDTIVSNVASSATIAADGTVNGTFCTSGQYGGCDKSAYAIEMSETLEATPLATAEWIKYVGAFYNRECELGFAKREHLTDDRMTG